MEHPKITGGIFIGLSQIPINTKVVDLLCQKKPRPASGEQQFVPVTFEYKKDYVVRCLNANKHNHITTTYYLLLKKMSEQTSFDPSDFKVFDDKAISQLIDNEDNESLT
jgi:hypothetical protein